MLTYASETWTLNKQDINRLNIFERKILRAIFGPDQIKNEWRIRYNNELYKLYKEPNIAAEIRTGRLRWAGHLIRMEDSRPAKRVLLNNPGGQRPRGRPRARWEDDVERDAGNIGVRNWTNKAKQREEWRRLLGTARTLNGLSC